MVGLVSGPVILQGPFVTRTPAVPVCFTQIEQTPFCQLEILRFLPTLIGFAVIYDETGTADQVL